MLLITVATMALSREPALALQMACAHQQHGIAVHDTSEMIHEDGAVTVAVERDAKLRTRAHHGGGQPSGWVEPQWRLMLRPSG